MRFTHTFFSRVLLGGILLFLWSPPVSAAPLQGIACESQQYCVYGDPRLQTSIGSMTAVPRFYHMAQQCYLQASMKAVIQYYQKDPFGAFAQSGVEQDWQMDRFCTGNVLEGERVINQHVQDNVRLLYQEGGASLLLSALERYDSLALTDPDALLDSVGVQTPEQFVADVFWREYLSYAQYLGRVDRTPDDFQRGKAWANDAVATNAGGSRMWSQFLRRQVELLAELDDHVDVQIAAATRSVSEIIFTEFLRSYKEHLEYLAMQSSLEEIRAQMDRLERAFVTLGATLPDAFITGN